MLKNLLLDQKTSVGILILIAMVFLVIFALRVKLIFVPIADLGGVEQNVIYSTQQAIDGDGLYTDPEVVPFNITQYTPIYYQVLKWTAKVMGIGGDEVRALYILNRSFSLLFNLLTLVPVYFLCSCFGLTRKWFASISLLVFAYMETQIFGRPDSLYCLLFVTTILGVLRLVKSDRISELYFWGLIVNLCFFTKQTALILFVLFAILAIFRRDKWLHRFLSLILPGILIFLWSGYSDHQIFLKNVVGGLNNGMDVRYFIQTFYHYFQDIGIWIMLSCFASIWMITRESSQQKLMGIVLMTLLLYAVVTALKFGSQKNYFTEYLMLSFVSIAVMFREGQPHLLKYSSIFFMCLALYFGAVRAIIFVWEKNYPIDYTEWDQQQAVAGYVKSKILTEKKVVIFDDHVVKYRGFLNNMLHKQSIASPKDIIDCCMNSRLDYSEFLNLVADDQLQFIITKNRPIPNSYLGADLSGNYQEVYSQGPYLVYSKND